MVNTEESKDKLNLLSLHLVSNATVVARSQNYVQSMGYSNSNAASTSGGILTPYSFYLTIEGITFVNFDLYLGSNIVPCSFCKPFDGAFETRFSNVNFINATSRVVAFNYEHQAYYTDLDGSLTGLTGGCILPSSGILPSDSCVNDISSYSAGIYPGAVCDNTVVPIRFGSNSVSPDSFNGQVALKVQSTLIFINSSPFFLCRIIWI